MISQAKISSASRIMLFVSLLTCAAGHAEAQSYSVETLGPPRTLIFAINNSGDTVGWTPVPDTKIIGNVLWTAFVHLHSDPPTSLQHIGPVLSKQFDYSGAYAINDSGEIVGSLGSHDYFDAAGHHPRLARVFRAQGAGTLSMVPVPKGTCNQPLQLNPTGDFLVGHCDASGGNIYLFNNDTLVRDYGVPTGIRGINKFGDAVGLARRQTTTFPAIFKRDGSIEYLDRLSQDDAKSFRPYLINDLGMIVGTAASGKPAILLPGVSRINVLDDFDGKSTGIVAINNSGVILGETDIGTIGHGAFLYANGKLLFLKDLIKTPPEYNLWLTHPRGMNDSGQIVVDGVEYVGSNPTPAAAAIPNSPTSFLLTPVRSH